MTENAEYARLDLSFLKQLRDNAAGLASRVGSLALSQEADPPIYSADVYEQLISMYVNIKAMILLVDLAFETGHLETEDNTEYLLIDPTMFIQITECSQMTMATYDALQSSHNINLTLH